jgi:TP901 family phage tail tape measure protein
MADQNLNLGTIFSAKLSSTFNKAIGGLKKSLNNVSVAQKKVAQSSDEVTKSTKAQNAGFGELTKRAVRVVAVYGSLAMVMSTITGAFKGGLTAIIEYDQALKNLQAITGATDTQVEGLGSTMRAVAEGTKYSIKEVADGAILLGQAGFTAEESMSALEAVAVLSTGTLSDMKNSTDLLTTAIRSFGLEASDSMKVADIFSSAVNKSKLTIEKLRTAFNYLGPIAHKAGLSLEEAAASAMILANSGLRASTIGTGMRQVLARLVSPSTKLQEAFHAAGVDLEKLNPLTNDFADIIEELTVVVPTAEKAFELFGLRGASAISALTEAGREGFEDMLRQVNRSNVAFDMAAKQMEGLGVKTKNLKDRLGVLAVAIGSGGVAGALKDLVQWLIESVKGLTDFINSPVGKITIWVGMITSIAVALGALVVGIKTAAVAMAGFVAANIAIIGPVAAVVTLIAGLVTAYRLLHRDIDQSLQQNREMAMSHKALGESFTRYIEGIIKVNKESAEAVRLDTELSRKVAELIAGGGELSGAALAVAESFDEWGRSTERTLDAVKELAELQTVEYFKSLGKITTDLVEKQQRLEKELNNLNAAYDRATNSVDGHAAIAIKLKEALEETEKELKSAKNTLNAYANEVVDAVQRTGKLDLHGSIDEFVELAESIGYPAEALKKLLPVFEKYLGEMAAVAKRGASRANDEIIRAIDPKAVTREIKKVVSIVEKEWNNLVGKTQNLSDDQLGIFKKYWNQVSVDARTNLIGLAAEYDRRYKEMENRGLTHSTEMASLAQLKYEMEMKVEKNFTRDLSVARAAKYKDRKEDLKKALGHEIKLIEAGYDQRMSSVEKGSSKELALLKSLNKDKIEAIKKNNQAQTELNKQHYQDMMVLAGENKEKQATALKEYHDVEASLLDERINSYRAMYDSFVSAAQDSTAKEKDIRESLVEIEKEIAEERKRHAEAVFDLELSLVDKINAIKKKGLEGVAKEKFIEAEATAKLKAAYTALETAIRNKDATAIAGAKALLTQASSLFGSLKDQKTAIDGIQQAHTGLRQVENFNHSARMGELNAEKQQRTLQLNVIKLQVKVYKLLYTTMSTLLSQTVQADQTLKKQMEEPPDTSEVVGAIGDVETSIKELEQQASETDLEVDTNFEKVEKDADKTQTAIKKFNDIQLKKVSLSFVGKGSSERPIIDKINEITAKLETFIAFVLNTKPKLIVGVDTSAVETAVAYLNSLVTTSIHKVTADVSAAMAAINSLKATTHSTHIVNIETVGGGSGDTTSAAPVTNKVTTNFVGKGSSEKPITDKIKEVKSKLKNFASFVQKAKDNKVTTNFVGKGSSEKPITDKIKEVKSKVLDFTSFVQKAKAKLKVNVDTEAVKKAVTHIKEISTESFADASDVIREKTAIAVETFTNQIKTAVTGGITAGCAGKPRIPLIAKEYQGAETGETGALIECTDCMSTSSASMASSAASQEQSTKSISDTIEDLKAAFYKQQTQPRKYSRIYDNGRPRSSRPEAQDQYTIQYDREKADLDKLIEKLRKKEVENLTEKAKQLLEIGELEKKSAARAKAKAKEATTAKLSPIMYAPSFTIQGAAVGKGKEFAREVDKEMARLIKSGKSKSIAAADARRKTREDWRNKALERASW